MHIRVILSSALLGGAVALATPAFAGVLGGGIGLGGSASGGLGGNLGVSHGNTAIHSDAATRHAGIAADGGANTNAGTAANTVNGTAGAMASTTNGAIDTGLSASVSGNTANAAPAGGTKAPEGKAQQSASGSSSSHMETQAH
jgi:hypothetical protein